MTKSNMQGQWLVCKNCTGLLKVDNPAATKDHISECHGDLNSSTCSHFAVEKCMLLELLMQDIEPLEPAAVDEATGKELVEAVEPVVESHSPKKTNRKKRKASDDFVPVSVKEENCDILTEKDDGNVRRSKRKPKPKRNDDHEWYGDKIGSNKEDEDINDINDDAVHGQTSELSLQAVILSESTGTEQEGADDSALMSGTMLQSDTSLHTDDTHGEVESAPLKEVEQVEVQELLPTKEEPSPVNNKSQKASYTSWKQQLAEDYVQYRETGQDKDGKEEEVYRCPKCMSRTFPPNRIGMFRRHLKTCKPSGSTALNCPEPGCDYVAKDAKRFSEHKRYHLQPYMCEFCSRRFADKRNMIDHRMTHTDERPLACSRCDYRTRNKRLLKEHERKHTGKFLHCTEPGCSFFTPYHGSLVTHVELKHRTRNKHRCAEPSCTFVTNSKGALQRHHLTRHTGIKNYQCSLCSYKAVSKFAVISHLRSHTKEKIYFCDKCNYSASYASAFRQHMMTHFGLKTWQCGPCGYNSNTRAKVIRHLINKHPDVDPNSSVVNLGLSLKLDLAQFRRGTEQKFLIEEMDMKDEATMEVMQDETRASVEQIEEERAIPQTQTISTRMGKDGQIQIVQGLGEVSHEVLQEAGVEELTHAGSGTGEMGQIVDVGGEEIVITEQMLNGTQELIVMTEDGNIIVPAGGFGGLQEQIQAGTVEEMQETGMAVHFVEEMQVHEQELETS